MPIDYLLSSNPSLVAETHIPDQTQLCQIYLNSDLESCSRCLGSSKTTAIFLRACASICKHGENHQLSQDLTPSSNGHERFIESRRRPLESVERGRCLLWSANQIHRPRSSRSAIAVVFEGNRRMILRVLEGIPRRRVDMQRDEEIVKRRRG
ncbi:unnamed protein product [Linum trigynum]|uniref:Uncharacterized protein n=1 Tax=Linum trigynum TaxID=586398 RepID=A0AAV2ERF9_9ROSI